MSIDLQQSDSYRNFLETYASENVENNKKQLSKSFELTNKLGTKHMKHLLMNDKSSRIIITQVSELSQMNNKINQANQKRETTQLSQFNKSRKENGREMNRHEKLYNDVYIIKRKKEKLKMFLMEEEEKEYKKHTFKPKIKKDVKFKAKVNEINEKSQKYLTDNKIPIRNENFNDFINVSILDESMKYKYDQLNQINQEKINEMYKKFIYNDSFNKNCSQRKEIKENTYSNQKNLIFHKDDYESPVGFSFSSRIKANQKRVCLSKYDLYNKNNSSNSKSRISILNEKKNQENESVSYIKIDDYKLAERYLHQAITFLDI